MKLWRIAAETRDHAADDLSGAGAARFPGRWNDANEAVVYCAPTIAMAVLETAAHIDDGGFPLNRYVIEIDVPVAVWRAKREIVPPQLPPAWDAIPAGRASVEIGSAWLASLASAILLLPSVIIPEERVALVNPSHPQSPRIKAKVVRGFQYARLFRR